MSTTLQLLNLHHHQPLPSVVPQSLLTRVGVLPSPVRLQKKKLTNVAGASMVYTERKYIHRLIFLRVAVQF